ncbi:DUF4219 domain-containing protein [Tanacetum coccineum]
MAQENYVEGCSMQIPPLLESDGFCFWKARFETHIKSKDIDLWKVIRNDDFYFEIEDSETKMMKESFKNCKIDLLTQEYEKFLISNEEAINSGFTRFNAIVTILKYLDPDYSSKNHVRKFLRALPLKWRAKVTTIEEAKDLATLSFDELVSNLKVYEMILKNDGIASKTTTKEKVKSLALKAKVTREQTSDDSDSQGGSDEDVDEEEAEAFNLMPRNFYKFFRKGNRFGHGNRCGNGANRFGRGRENSFGNKGSESSRQKGVCYNYRVEGHFASECTKPKENKALSEEHRVIDLDIIDLKKENEELLRFNKDFTKTFENLLIEKRALESENSKLLSKVNDLGFEVKKLINDKRWLHLAKRVMYSPKRLAL